jgi:hypothetical protein
MTRLKERSTQKRAILKCGDGGNRTPDTRIFSPLLYQLSYITGTSLLTRYSRASDRGTKLDKFTFGAKHHEHFLGILNY